MDAGASRRARRRTTSFAMILLAGLYALCLIAGPAPAFVAPGEGASWALMDSLASRFWTGASLETRAGAIDPDGAFADPFTRARDGRWYSKAPPLLPLIASFPYAVLGTLGAYAVPAAAVIAAFLIALGIARSLLGEEADDGRSVAAALGVVAATPVIVHGALFCGHAPAAALVLGAASFFMDSCARGFPSLRKAAPSLAGAGLCAGLAALAQPEAIWFTPAALGAWAILREGRPRVAVTEGSKWRIAFLALASALHVAAALLVSRLTAPSPGWGDEWGSTILLPVMAPAGLALFGLAESIAERVPTRARAVRFAWIAIVTLGFFVQAGGLRHALGARAESDEIVNAIAAAAQPGEAVLSESPSVPGIAATLSSTRSLFFVRPGASTEGIVAALEAAGVHGIAIVSGIRAGEGGSEPLAMRRFLGRFMREGDPQRAGGFHIARFVSGGPSASRPSEPPRGD